MHERDIHIPSNIDPITTIPVVDNSGNVGNQSTIRIPVATDITAINESTSPTTRTEDAIPTATVLGDPIGTTVAPAPQLNPSNNAPSFWRRIRNLRNGVIRQAHLVFTEQMQRLQRAQAFEEMLRRQRR